MEHSRFDKGDYVSTDYYFLLLKFSLLYYIYIKYYNIYLIYILKYCKMRPALYSLPLGLTSYTVLACELLARERQYE